MRHSLMASLPLDLWSQSAKCLAQHSVVDEFGRWLMRGGMGIDDIDEADGGTLHGSSREL